MLPDKKDDDDDTVVLHETEFPRRESYGVGFLDCDDAATLNEEDCSCEPCSFWQATKSSQVFIWIFGSIVPLIWIYCLVKTTTLLFQKGEKMKSEPDGCIQMGSTFKKKRFVFHDVGGSALHRRNRQELWQWFSHLVLAMVIYASFALIVVSLCFMRPVHPGTGEFFYSLQS